ncbi:helix-turn-helix domain-containing protein [Flavobacterium sp. NG2]|uniref:helix-turn-helix domain-containing protein n=1 Tax=Flavobacterium sp. NG2 TaxID=3097547 RepID=UPI002A7F53BA|nr:helix-turn-helix domain-containing protein [Flavobacterium sp. NG2]WPR70376.1 helix-turn-helix domain-containing protein [Flavobacterium sp. NG2]
MLYLTGVVITFFLAFILLSKSHKTIADKILFFWLISIGLHLLLFYIFFSGKYIIYPYTLGLSIPLPLIHGPFLFLYTAAVTNQSKNWKINSLHFLPVILCYFSISNFLLLPNESKILIYKNEGAGYETLQNITLFAILCSGIVYVIWSLTLLKKHKKNILNQFSYMEKINLVWLRYLIYGIALIWLFVVIGNDELLFSVVVLFVVFIGYFGINQVGLFSKIEPVSQPKINYIDKKSVFIENEDKFNIIEDKTSKYVKSGLNEETAKKIHHLLTLEIENNKLFTNSELTLVELSEILNVHPNHLSQVINTFEVKNFYDYINSKRIEHFISLLDNTDNQKYTIISLAYECGFNSKSSFNKYFKKVTNQTPTEYMKAIT